MASLTLQRISGMLRSKNYSSPEVVCVLEYIINTKISINSASLLLEKSREKRQHTAGSHIANYINGSPRAKVSSVLSNKKACLLYQYRIIFTRWKETQYPHTKLKRVERNTSFHFHVETFPERLDLVRQSGFQRHVEKLLNCKLQTREFVHGNATSRRAQCHFVIEEPKCHFFIEERNKDLQAEQVQPQEHGFDNLLEKWLERWKRFDATRAVGWK